MSILEENPRLNTYKHPFVVRDAEGNFVARFSNAKCAARTILYQPIPQGRIEVEEPNGLDWEIEGKAILELL